MAGTKDHAQDTQPWSASSELPACIYRSVLEYWLFPWLSISTSSPAGEKETRHIRYDQIINYSLVVEKKTNTNIQLQKHRNKRMLILNIGE